MINLLPNDYRKELRAARANVILLRYMGVLALAGLFLAFTIYGSIFLLEQTRSSAKILIASNDTKADVYDSTKNQIDALSGSLVEAKSILDQETPYSNILTNLAQLMPANTVIGKLTLDAKTISTSPVTMTIYAKTTNDTVTLKDRFQNSPLFSNVNFETVSDSNSGVSGYPVSATLTLTINKAATK